MKSNRITEAGTAADSDMQSIVTTSADIEANPMLPAVPPDDCEETDDAFCSNFDGIINADVVAKLKTENLKASYPAWDWHGTVWFDKQFQKFCCKVMRYGSHINTIYADTEGELVNEVSNRYGWS